MIRRLVVLAALAACVTASAAPPATAGTLHGSSERDRFCGGFDHTVTFTAASGERNNVTVGQVHREPTHPFDPFPECPYVTVGSFTFSDVTETIWPTGGCRFVVGLTNRLARCPSGELSISLGDMNDSIVIESNFVREVSCGPGRDTVIARDRGLGGQDHPPFVGRDCEIVVLPR